MTDFMTGSNSVTSMAQEGTQAPEDTPAELSFAAVWKALCALAFLAGFAVFAFYWPQISYDPRALYERLLQERSDHETQIDTLRNQLAVTQQLIFNFELNSRHFEEDLETLAVQIKAEEDKLAQIETGLAQDRQALGLGAREANDARALYGPAIEKLQAAYRARMALSVQAEEADLQVAHMDEHITRQKGRRDYLARQAALAEADLQSAQRLLDHARLKAEVIATQIEQLPEGQPSWSQARLMQEEIQTEYEALADWIIGLETKWKDRRKNFEVADADYRSAEAEHAALTRKLAPLTLEIALADSAIAVARSSLEAQIAKQHASQRTASTAQRATAREEAALLDSEAALLALYEDLELRKLQRANMLASYAQAEAHYQTQAARLLSLQEEIVAQMNARDALAPKIAAVVADLAK